MTRNKLTHTDKIFWPKKNITKGQMIAYYDEMADYILPYIKDRPQVMKRYPDGIDGDSFYQKNVTGELPPFVRTKIIHSETEDKDARYIICQNKETLIYLANLGCIELHVWNSRQQQLEYPDYVVIDLDPLEVAFKEVVKVARTIHDFLSGLNIDNYCRTSGATGLHIYIPLGSKYTYDQARIFTELLVNCVHREIPDITSLDRNPKKRRHKVYLDYLQNRYGQTLPAAYSLRALPYAPVATPLHWDEVTEELNSQSFTIFNIQKRLSHVGDLWKGIFRRGVDLASALNELKKKNPS